MMPVRYFRLLIFVTQILVANTVVAPATAATDPVDDDMGFTQQSIEVRTGWLMRRAFSARDMEASFIINDVPIYYNRPRGMTRVQSDSTERHLRATLANARANSADWHRLAVLLEDGACFYRKVNSVAESLSLMNELVSLLQAKAPNSDDLCNAQIGYAQVASAAHQFNLAEHLYKEALDSALQRHGAADQLVTETRVHLFYLYYDLGRVDKAIAMKRDVIHHAGYDAVADNDVSSKIAGEKTWPDIVDQIDAAETTAELASMENQADAAARRALKRDWSTDASDDWTPKHDADDAGDGDADITKKKDGKDEKPIPYRLPGSRGQ